MVDVAHIVRDSKHNKLLIREKIGSNARANRYYVVCFRPTNFTLILFYFAIEKNWYNYDKSFKLKILSILIRTVPAYTPNLGI